MLFKESYLNKKSILIYMNHKLPNLPNEILNIIFSYRQPNPICKELNFYIEIHNRLPSRIKFHNCVLKKVLYHLLHPMIYYNRINFIIRGYECWNNETFDETYVSFSNYVINVRDKDITKDGYLLSYNDNDALRCCFLQP